MADEVLDKDEPKYAAYPRTAYGLGYGTLAQMVALGKFCKDFEAAFFATIFALLVVEGVIAALNTPLKPLIAFVLVFSVFYVLLKSRMANLSHGLGWKSGIGVQSALLLAAVASLAFSPNPFPQFTFFVPPVALAFGSMALLVIANRELNRYGVKISPWTFGSPRGEFEAALLERKAWEDSPHPPGALS